MGDRLSGRVALVTGGANGIGRACCERFAEEGSHVVVADRHADGADAVAAAIVAAGGSALGVVLDAASPEGNDAAVAAAVARFGTLDVLVTAAGITHARYASDPAAEADRSAARRAAGTPAPGASLAALDLDDWRRVLDVNLTGTVLAVRAAAPVMLSRGRGSIVTVASVAAVRPGFGIPYGVSKAGVWRFTKDAAVDLAAGGVRVNALGPGWVETAMTAGVASTPATRAAALGIVPMGRFGRPREIADAALFLASDESSYVTGELLHPDGGMFTG